MLGIVLCLIALEPPVVRADSAGPAAGVAAGTSAVAIVPADGKARGIRLRSETVNTVITQDAAGVWADTDLEVLLQNRGKAPVVLPVGFPGPQAAAYVTNTLGLPQISDVTLDKKPLAFSPLGPGERSGIRASAVITVPVEATVALRVLYRQVVPLRDDLAAYAYPLNSGNVWAGPPESLSVQVTFRPPLAEEQNMHLTPGARSPRPGAYRWTWNGVKAPSNIAAVFVTDSWWSGLKGARAAAAAPDAGLAEHSALAERYLRLATLAPPAFAPGVSLYDRTFPLALAELRAAVASGSTADSPQDLARTRERLAGLYLAQGSREGDSSAQTYLQLAVDELAAAVALDPKNEELTASATALQERLARTAVSRGDGVMASAHSARLAALAAGQSALSPDQEKQQGALAQAEAAVASGDLPGARSLLEEALGPEALRVPDIRAPIVTQVLLKVRSDPRGREIAMQLVDGARRGSAGELVQETVEALRRIAPVVSAGSALTITLAYTDPVTLLAAQDRLAAALPREPELALLSSALSTRRLAWPEQANLLNRISGYEERVDLSRGAGVWRAEAAKLETAADQAAGSNELLDQVRSTLWRADARAWRDVAALSRATYVVELREQGAGPDWLQARVHEFYREGSVDREWVIRAGETRQLETAVLGWRYDRVALAAAAALLLVVVAATLLWIVSR